MPQTKRQLGESFCHIRLIYHNHGCSQRLQNVWKTDSTPLAIIDGEIVAMYDAIYELKLWKYEIVFSYLLIKRF